MSAIRRLASLTFDDHEAHPDFMRLVSIENIRQAEHAASPTPRSLNAPVIAIIDRILRAGREQGVFTAEVDAVDLHMMICAFCCFRITNRRTFGALFGRDLTAPDRRDHCRTLLCDMGIAYPTTVEQAAIG